LCSASILEFPICPEAGIPIRALLFWNISVHCMLSITVRHGSIRWYLCKSCGFYMYIFLHP
jgi:hypothetical protein